MNRLIVSQLNPKLQYLDFSLSNGRISYLFRASPEGILEHIHFGAAVSLEDYLPAGPRREFRGSTLEFQGIANYNLDDTPQEYPLFGSSDTRYPALHVLNGQGNTTNTLLYLSHEIVSSKPSLTNLPNARGGNSETLIVSLEDSVSQLLVKLHYTIYQDHDVIARSVEITNQAKQVVRLKNALSSSLDLPSGDYDVLHLKGTWSREFNTERLSVPHGRFVVESARGSSSNNHNPFLAIMDKQATEQHGDVIGTALMYSGNFCINVEKK